MSHSPTRVSAKKIVANAIAKATRPNAIARIKNIMRRVKERKGATKIAYMNPNGDYSLSEPVITGRTVTFQYTPTRFILPTTLPRGFVSMEGRDMIKKPPVARITKSHAVLGEVSKVKHWYIKTTQGFAVFHKGSGTVQVSGKSIGIVARQLERVCPGISNAPARITKFDVEMTIGRYIKLDALAFQLPHIVSYEPELRNAAYVKWKEPALTLVVYTNGKVQIFGATKPKQAVDVVRQMIDQATPNAIFKKTRAYNSSGAAIPGAYEGYGMASRATPTRTEKLAKLRSNKLEGRHPAFINGRPVTYNTAPPPGKYIRPGPNGKARLYNVLPNMSLSATKIRKAYQNAGINMPHHVRTLLGGAYVMYGASEGAKRAKNWNSQLNGYYVAPGPGKQPHFYKIPKDLKTGYATAQKRYTSALIRMPNHVRNLFGVSNNVHNRLPSRAMNHVVQNNKVDGKSYKKLTVAQLVSVARNLGIAAANSKMSKDTLFEWIKSRATLKSKSPTKNPNVSVGGRMYTFTNDPTNQRILRNGHARVFSTLPRNERVAIMNRYFRGSNEYKVYKPKDWYNVLRAYKGIRAATPSTRSPTPNRVSSRSSTPNRGFGMPANIPGW
jgi:hypothetical protein